MKYLNIQFFKIKPQNHLQTMKRFEFKLKIPAEIPLRHILSVPRKKAVKSLTPFIHGTKDLHAHPPKFLEVNYEREKMQGEIRQKI